MLGRNSKPVLPEGESGLLLLCYDVIFRPDVGAQGMKQASHTTIHCDITALMGRGMLDPPLTNPSHPLRENVTFPNNTAFPHKVCSA